jgi:hypothetical protein
MAFYKIKSGRVNGQITSSQYIGNSGSIFYDDTDGELRLSDGVTPGGVAISVRADLITAGSLLPTVDNTEDYDLGSPTKRWHHLFIGDGGIKFDADAYPTAQTVPYLPGAQVDDIIPATDNGVSLGATDKRWANIYLGYNGLFLADQTTDANINITVNSGTLYVSGAENLRLGNLAIRDTTLTSANSTLDISIGDTGDTGYFYVKRKAQIDNVSFGATEAMLSVNASGGPEPLTLFPDTLIQTTSRPNKNSRIVQRSYGSSSETGGQNSYSVWASYVARGTVAAPAALKENDILARISANGYGATTWGSGGARVEFVALEDFTDSAKGSAINFWTVPLGQIASQNVASINSVGVVATGIKFSGDETVQTTAGIPLTAKAVSSATYVATLGVDGKLDATQIPSALTGAVVFKGVWNAATNTPALSDTTPAGLTAGWEYIVEVGGTRDIGDGSKVFVSGDFVIYDGTHWKQVPSGNLFTSLTGGGGITVNQSTGAIVLGSSATPLSTTATIVSRDSSGNFAANMITANLTGIVTGSVSGNAGSVTNGVYTTGGQTIDGTKTFTSTIQGTITSATLAAGVVGGVGVYTLTAGTGTAVSASSGTVTVWFNTGTLVTQAVTAGTVTTAAQPAITSVGTLTSLTVTNLVTAKNYSGQVRNLGTITPGAGTEITIDFATDHMVRFSYTAEPVQIAFTNYSAGKTVTLIAVNTNAGNRQLEIGIAAANAQGASTLDINGNTTGIVTYYCTGATVNDVFASTVYVI